MAWQDHTLRLIGRGLLSPAGEPLDLRVLARVIVEIADDPELSARLDSLDEQGVRAELLARYDSARTQAK